MAVIANGRQRAMMRVEASEAGGVEQEPRALRQLAVARPESFVYPKLLEGGEMGRWSYGITAPIVMGAHRMAVGPDLGTICGELSAAVTPPERAANVPKHWVPSHGDLTPWNLRARGVGSSRVARLGIGHFSGGEIRYLWDRDLDELRLCGCGVRVVDCEVWSQVLAQVPPETIDTPRMLADLELSPSHTVSGNPGRFQTGAVARRSDDAWRRDQHPRDRLVVDALTWPLARMYGYHGLRESTRPVSGHV